jgi:histidinol-phosphate phosphatase family protein
MGNRAVFLDRDGTIARDVHYCRRPEDFELLPTAPEAIRLLNDSDFKVIVITNQSGIARGYFTEHTLAKIHEKMENELARDGARVDAIYYCPHHPDDGCDCRKPGTALYRRAAQEVDVDFHQSYVVGDMPMDVEAGRNLGCTTVLVATEPKQGKDILGSPDYTAGTLLDAAQWITRHAEAFPKPRNLRIDRRSSRAGHNDNTKVN